MRRDIMLCYPFEEKRFKKWDTNVLVQPKLDGVRMRVELANPVRLLSSEGNDLSFALPHIHQELTDKAWKFRSEGIFELDGEAYNHDMEFEDIVSITGRSTNLHSDFSLINYHIFDHVSDAPNYRRVMELIHIFLDTPFNTIQLVDTTNAVDIETTMEMLRRLHSDGYEGIIVRHPLAPYVRKRSRWMMKFKPKKSDTYKIVGMVEEYSIHGEPKGRLGALVLSDEEGNVFKAGSGLTAEQREVYWRDDVVGRYAIISYQHTTAGGIPRFPVVVEVL